MVSWWIPTYKCNHLSWLIEHYFLAPLYNAWQRSILDDLLYEIQTQLNIRFTHYIKETDRAYITIKKSTKGCYAVAEAGHNSEKVTPL